MKLTLVLLITGMLQVSASTSAQNINLSVKDVSLKKVFKELRQQTGFNFLYNSKMLNETSPVSLSVKDMPFTEVLDKCFNNQPVTYVIVQNTIIVKKKVAPVSTVQDITVSGTVKDTKGEPIPGVSVRLKGTTTGAVTDVNGAYHLNAPDGTGTLVFSFIGFETQEVPINNNAHINIVLKEQSSALNEVVVTALGVKRSEQSLTYATQQVTRDEVNQVKTDNLMNALSGKVAGVNITPSASGVGGSSKVILRGSRSANGNNQPLYVIDGIPILNSGNANGQPNGSFGGSTDSGDGISNLNPEDIASISVLEGASAAALYGSQAQNGVILITTKKGKAGKALINYTSSFSVDHVAYEPKFQNSYGQTPGTGGVSGDPTSWGAPISGSQDNLKDFFQNGTNWTNAINLSSGSETAQTYFSYANTHATGIEPGNKLDRNNFNLRETGNFLNNKLTVDGSVNYINQNIDNSPQLGIYSNPLLSLYNFPRGVNILPYKEQYENPGATGAARQNWVTQNSGDFHQDNPWWIINREPNTATRNRLLMSGSVKYDFTSWLSLQVRGNVDRISDDFEQDFYSGSNSLYNSLETGAMKLNNQTLTQKYGDVLLNFSVPLQHSDFKISGLLGGSITDQQTQGYAFGGNLSTPDFFTPGNIIVALPGTTTTNTTLNTLSPSFAVAPNHNQLQALFANLDLSYKSWVYLNLTGRNDWSSNLSYTNNDSYFYPSAGLSVILSQALKLPDAISYAKIRGTFAQVGNTIPAYLTNIQNTQNGSGSLVFNTAAAPNTLKPEKTNSFELGTDLRFFNNLLNFSFTYYKTNTLNQYVPVSYSAPSLVSTGYVNAGNVQNTGFEFILGYDVFHGHDFGWNTSFNGAMNRNKIIDVDSKDGVNTFYLTNDGNGYQSELTKGGSYGDIYAPTILKNAQGQIVLSGAGTAASPYLPQKTPGAYQFVGNPNPKFQLGWSNTFNYQKFSLEFLVDGKFGGQVMSITQSFLDESGVSAVSGQARDQGGVKINGVNSAGQAVTTVNAQNWYQTLGQRGGITGEYMYSATVVRLREAALGYTWPVTNSAFKSIKLSLTGRNLIYFYKKAPFDPEITESTGNGLSGIDVFNQPATRNVGLNLNVSF